MRIAKAEPAAIEVARRDILSLLGVELAARDAGLETPLSSLVVDSFGMIEAAFRFESVLGVTLHSHELSAIDTLGDLAALVAERRTRPARDRV